MKKVILCGSLAYDHILVSRDSFEEKIKKYNDINISLSTKELRKEYGGCAGNIAYSLSKLGMRVDILSSLGSEDASYYIKHLKKNNISIDYIKVFDGVSAQAYIINDIHNNQITSFYLGSLVNIILDFDLLSYEYIIISSDNIVNMRNYIEYCIKFNKKYVFDPGQVTSLFKTDELKRFIAHSYLLILNNFEFNILQDIFNNKIFNIAEKIIITEGEKGSLFYERGKLQYKISSYKISKKDLLDPTGCGDAYRAGVIYGLLNNNILIGMRLGNYLASCNLKFYGTQQYQVNRKVLKELMNNNEKITN